MRQDRSCRPKCNRKPRLAPGGEKAIFLLAHAFFRMVLGDYQVALEVAAEGSNLTLGGERGEQLAWVQAMCLKLLGREEEMANFRARAGSSLYKNEAYLLYLLEESGELDEVFGKLRVGIENHDRLLFDSLRLAAYWDPLRHDPRVDELVALLASKETHTSAYLLAPDSTA